jgi:NAD(P)-dependent dehydrogenase (short-subunit alcohol dehydrogenase family)
MAIEFAPEGIRVNAVLPGAVDTPMLHDGFRRGVLAGETVESRVAELARRTPLGRIARPEEIGQSILFLADGARSSFITGQTLIVDGGATAHLSTE